MVNDMKKRILVLALAMLLAGCSDTTVYIPEDGPRLEADQVVYIPMDPEKPSEEEAVPTEPVPTQPEETEPEQKHTATVSKKNTGTSNKGNTSSSKDNTTNKETVTGSGKPAQTQPAPTEEPGNSGQITVTIPAETEPLPTETPVTEPPATEVPETEPPATEVPETEPPATEIPETEPPATEPPMTEPPATEPPLYDISDYAVSDLEYAMLERINEYRLEADLEELWMDEYLCAIASCRAYESSLVWSHTRPDGRGYWTVLDDYGYGGGASGELLGYSTGDGAAVVDKWMSSDSHSALLMSSSSTIGIGIYCSGGVIYVAVLLI